MLYIGMLGRMPAGLLFQPRARPRSGRGDFVGCTAHTPTKSRGGAALPDLTVAAAANPTGSHVRVGLAGLGFRV